MQPINYYKNSNSAERKRLTADIARAADVTEGAVRHWLNGIRKPSPLHTLKLEAKGFGTKTYWRPDIYPKEH